MKLLPLLLATAFAVKDHLFKKCDQNPFCSRNRHYARQQKQMSFESPYALQNVEVGDAVSGTLVKSTPHAEVELSFSLELLDTILHLTIDEPVERRSQLLESHLAKERFSPAPFMLTYDTLPSKAPFISKKSDKNSLVLEHGEYTVEIQLAPFKLSFGRNGKAEIVLNEHALLNFEHVRARGADERNSWESDFGAWEDTFDGHTDKKSKGPEAVALDISFNEFNHVYGIPEHADVLNLRTTTDKEPYRLYNVDIFEYETNSPMPMYGSIPFMLAQKSDASAGVLWLNAADTYIDIGREAGSTSTHWISETGVLDVYLMLGSSPADIVKQYSLLTGTAFLPQLFSIAYHQCRWNYNSEVDVLDVNEKFDDSDIPYDVIWLDIEYTINKKYFTWNPDTFPDPTRMLEGLDKQSRKLVAIIDPHIKAEPGYKIYDDLMGQSLAVLDAQAKNPFEGHCWPGNSVWVEPFHPKVQQYWDSLHAMGGILEPSSHNIHIWNDMNEPSVFSGPETSAPKSLVHYGGWEHRDLHNLYGHEYVNRTFDSMNRRYDSEQRPFILTRSFFAGSQRLAAMWTGDNMSKWEYLKQAIPQVLTLGSVGMPFAGADVGGFFGNPDNELLTRWYQSGIFYPFFRAHAHIDARRREPYLLEDKYQEVIRDAIELRYKLLPTIYTAFHEASTDLKPVLRPVYFEVPSNPETFSIDDAFFLGDSLYAKPVSDPDAQSISIYIPEDEYYYNYWTNARIEGPGEITQRVHLDTIPMFARGGKIHFRRDRPRRSSELMVNDPFTIVIATGKDGTASGHIYLDDGISYDYQNGDFVETQVTFDGTTISARSLNQAKSAFKDLAVEKIIVIGSRASAASYADTHFDVEPITGGYTIRNPRVPIGSDWVINLS